MKQDISHRYAEKPLVLDAICHSGYSQPHPDAILAQLAERVTCNLEVLGSIPRDGSSHWMARSEKHGEIPEWSKGADCKSVGSAFEGSNPSLSKVCRRKAAFFAFRPLCVSQVIRKEYE